MMQLKLKRYVKAFGLSPWFLPVRPIKFLINFKYTDHIKSDRSNKSFRLMEKVSEVKQANYFPLKILEVSTNIELTETEKNIFELILGVLKEEKLDTVCRVAGGWVRDKLLGRKSDDIDIALDNISGEKLARLINSRINKEKDKVGVVKSNPDKSKHLETATMKIEGQFVDFVNLRTETYSESSRIPIISIGTPLEDAQRRDITINSMFYNINEGKVEDHLGTGISDLKRGLVQTPIDPIITFKDDPLRILRTVRFATRFQFELDQRIIDAARITEIKASLKEKISNERIHKELSLMFTGNLPFSSIRILHDMTVLEDIIKIPSEVISDKTVADDLITQSVLHAFIVDHLINQHGEWLMKILNPEGTKECKESNDELIFIKDLSMYLALVHPFKEHSMKVKKETINLAVHFIKNSFMLSNDMLKISQQIIDLLPDLEKFLADTSKETLLKSKLELGLLMRKIGFKNLKFFVIISISSQYAKDFIDASYEVDQQRLSKIMESMTELISFLQDEDILHSDSIKAYLDGKQIAELLALKPGKQIGILSNKCIEIQILNPKISKEELLEQLRSLVNNL